MKENGEGKEGDVLEGVEEERENGETDGVQEVMLLPVRRKMQ